MEEEKKYLDYEGLLEYHRNIKELILENEKITSSALNDLNNRIIENEKVISSALNDLDDRIEAGSNLNEVEIGRTTPSDPNIKIFIDEDEDPAVSLDVYTRAQTDTLLAGKVDKVTGKGLSTNDFDDTSKDKLDDLPSTSETAVSGGTDLSLVTTGEKYNWNARIKALEDAIAEIQNKLK